MYSINPNIKENNKIEQIFFFNLKNESIKVDIPQNIARNDGIKINAKGMNFLNSSSNVSELVIQYKLNIK